MLPIITETNFLYQMDNASTHPTQDFVPTLPPSNIGEGRIMNIQLTQDNEYVAVEYLPTGEEYAEALKKTPVVLPRATGIYLSFHQATALSKLVPVLHAERVKLGCGKKVDFCFELGNNIYVTGNSDYRCFHIRRYWQPPNSLDIHPTKVGVVLKESEILAFLSIFPTYANHVNQPVFPITQEPNFIMTRPPLVPSQDGQGNMMSEGESTQVEFRQL